MVAVVVVVEEEEEMAARERWTTRVLALERAGRRMRTVEPAG
jgi:hypothetical protein